MTTTSTLPSLSKQSAKEVEDILASLTLDMLPNPRVGSSRGPGLDPKLRDRLIEEIRIRLALKRNDDSRQAMSKIYGYLAEEIGRHVLAGVDIKEVKNRLGQRGDLAPSLYKIEFGPVFKDQHEKRGVDRRDVERTLQTPDSVEHLHPDLEGIDTEKATSLYLKAFTNIQSPSKTYSLLVFCQRKGYVQNVLFAWMIFHSEVDLSQAKTALDGLRAFVDKYGLDITVGERSGRFFWYERVPVPTGKTTNLIEVKRSPDETGSIALVVESVGVVNGVMQIAYAFAVNDSVYEEDLKRHGIRIRKQPPTGPAAQATPSGSKRA